MSDGIERVRGKHVLIQFQARRCIHSRHCVLERPDVFVPNVQERRMQAVLRLNRAVRELALAGIREAHPAASDSELRVRLTVRLYGRAVAERLFESVPADAR